MAHSLQKHLGRLFAAAQFKIDQWKSVYNSAIINNPTGRAVVSGKVILQYPKHITIGDNSYINGGWLCASPNAYIKVGKNCLISYNVHIRTDMHIHHDKEKLIQEQGNKEADIIIGNDVWIGCGAQIFGGVTLGEGCVIGAGTIVTKDVSPYEIVVGGAMRGIGERNFCFEEKKPK